MRPNTQKELRKEERRLYSKLAGAGFDRGRCKLLAPLTLEINKLKKAHNAVILAHSYQTPDIIYGVADHVGDSYQLSREAQKTSADVIVFCGVKFMAETARILNPGKVVLLPAPDAGCSLADAVTAADVRKLKRQHPGVPVVCYVNTTAAVKAESDVCCTSANALKIVNALPGREVIFIPDELMAQNVAAMTDKRIISWPGRCIVHEKFKAGNIALFRNKHPGLNVLAHTECEPEVIAAADFAGGTEGMIRHVKSTRAPSYMLVTECGLTDRMKVEAPGKKFIGMCVVCPYMKRTTLQLVLKALKNPDKSMQINVAEKIRAKAEKSLLKMFELSR